MRCFVCSVALLRVWLLLRVALLVFGRVLLLHVSD